MGEIRQWAGGWQSTEEGWITVREAAAELGVSHQRVHQLIRDGRLHARLEDGRLVVVDRSSLAAFRATVPVARAGRLRLSGLADLERELGSGWMLPVQVAEELGVCRQRVHQLVAEGRIRSRRLGARGVIVERVRVEAYKRSRRPGGQPHA